MWKKIKELNEDIDLSVLYTDIHSHFLPGIDDGSKSMEESIFLLKQMEDFGYKKVITTPHIYYDSFPEGINILDTKLEELRKNAKLNGIKLEIEVGGEYLLDEDISERIKNKQIKTFSDNLQRLDYPQSPVPLKWSNLTTLICTKSVHIFFYTYRKAPQPLPG